MNPILSKRDLFIKPIFSGKYEGSLCFDVYVDFLQQILRQTLPDDLKAPLLKQKNRTESKKAIRLINESVPLFYCELPEQTPRIASFSMLCPASFTHGVGRYASDAVCRWLVPGKFFSLLSVHSMVFSFIDDDRLAFFLHNITFEIEDSKELQLVKNNLNNLMEEMRLSILAVKNARHVMHLSKLSNLQKSVIIEENLSTIFNRTSKKGDSTIYDQIHHFFLKAAAEEKLGKMKQSFMALIEKNPSLFDRDIYSQIQHFVLLFRGSFTALRSLKHIGKMISYQYLFRKLLEYQVKQDPQERHVVFKLLKTKLQKIGHHESVIGLIVGINLLHDRERFEKPHILKALKQCLHSLKEVKDSYIVDQRSNDRVRLFYIECMKEDGLSFSLEELKTIKNQIQREIKSQFESVLQPIFMPRNDEEILRNMIVLANQLKYVKDIPQMVMSFEGQTEKEISFLVVLLRLVSQGHKTSVESILLEKKSSLQASNFEIKHVGYLRNKYLKEATVFKAIVDKKGFLRKDYSLDIFKARQFVFEELCKSLGDIRDFNGGMLSKQHEAFKELRDYLWSKDYKDDFALETFFHSIQPPLMRNILPLELLGSGFSLAAEGEKKLLNKSIFLDHKQIGSYVIFSLNSKINSFKEVVLQSLSRAGSPSVAFAFTEIYGIASLVIFVKKQKSESTDSFLEPIKKALSKWEKSL
ncbi:MAG: hypothetical protein ACOVOR_04570 [Rhabdochlamydiaceae bacterium]